MVTNRQLLLPYAAPYLAYVGIASLPVSLVAPEINYLFRLALVPLLIAWGWRWYCPLGGPRSLPGSILTGLVAGLVGLVMWLGLLAPFVHADGAASWSMQGFFLRLLCAGLLVPVFEELMIRGFLFRLALQWDQARTSGHPDPLHAALDNRSINDVAPGSWSWAAIILSTAAFASGHAMVEWPAAVGYGLLMVALWIYRQDLVTSITAHAVTNIGLALFVYTTGSWHFW